MLNDGQAWEEAVAVLLGIVLMMMEVLTYV
jgi:hypothetical protein